MEKIYKVFVSSTYTDLKDERKTIIQTLLESDCIPIEMEMFHIADKNQWKLIQNEITSCDFFIIIIGGRYGNVHPKTKISYTQMEYEYAYKIGIPILALFYENPKKLSLKIDNIEFSQKNLEEFKIKLAKENDVKLVNNLYNLAYLVKTSIYKIIKDNLSGGWVRYKDLVDNNQDNINTSEMSKQINELNRQTHYNNYINDYIYQIYSKNFNFSLNCMHISALNEITNMMFSAGITALSEYLDMTIKADYSYIQLCKNSIDIDMFINSQDKYGLLSEFYINRIHNKIHGKIFLNLSLKVVKKMFTILAKDYPQFIINHEYDYLKSALQELTNIFVGANLTALSILLNLKVQMSARIINTDIKKVNLLKRNDTILISKFSNDINEHNLFDAYLILEPSSVKSLLEATGLPVM